MTYQDAAAVPPPPEHSGKHSKVRKQVLNIRDQKSRLARLMVGSQKRLPAPKRSPAEKGRLAPSAKPGRAPGLQPIEDEPRQLETVPYVPEVGPNTPKPSIVKRKAISPAQVTVPKSP